MAEQQDGEIRIMSGDMPVQQINILHRRCPAILIPEMTARCSRRDVEAVAPHVMGIDEIAESVQYLGKAGITGGMLRHAMNDLDNRLRLFRAYPAAGLQGHAARPDKTELLPHSRASPLIPLH